MCNTGLLWPPLNHERSEWFKGGHKRPVLHIFRGGKVKSRGIVSFSVVCYFISLDPLFSHWFEFIWLKTSHPAKKPPPRQKNCQPATKIRQPAKKTANLPKNRHLSKKIFDMLHSNFLKIIGVTTSASVAQLIQHWTVDPGVWGSNPTAPNFSFS